MGFHWDLGRMAHGEPKVLELESGLTTAKP